MSTATPTYEAVHALVERCKARCISLRFKRWPWIAREDSDQNLNLACFDALRRWRRDHKSKATVESYAIALWKGLMAREHSQYRWIGVELDRDVSRDDQHYEAEPLALLYERRSELFNEREAVEREYEDERRIIERLAILPTNVGDFARAMANGALSSAQAAAAVGLQERQGRNLMLEALALLEARPRAAQLDLFGGAPL